MGATAVCDRQIWSVALARYREADAAFAPIQSAFDRAEQAWFAKRDERQGMSESELLLLRDRIGLDRAYEDEGRFGDAREAALRRLMHTPAPDLATVITKLELILETHFDDDVVTLILSDLTRLSDGGAKMGRAMP